MSKELTRVIMDIEYWRKPDTNDLIAVIESGEATPEILDYIRVVHDRAKHVLPQGKRKLSEHDVESQKAEARLMVLHEVLKEKALSGEIITKAEAIRRAAGKPLFPDQATDGWSERKLKGLLTGYKPLGAK